EVCRRLRQRAGLEPTYLILLTGKDSREDLVAGLEGGADEYLTKPIDPEELRVRLKAAARIVELQSKLAERVRELQDALTQVRQLRGLLPICMYCKRIREEENYWERVEAYISKHSAAPFSHGICPDCYETVVKPELTKA